MRSSEVGHPQSRLIQSPTNVFGWPAPFILPDLHPQWDAFSSSSTFHGEETAVAVPQLHTGIATNRIMRVVSFRYSFIGRFW